MNKHKAIRFYSVNCFVYANYILTMIVKEQYKLDNFAAIFLILLLSLTLLFGYKYLDIIMKNNMKIYSSPMGALM
jgi:hypothetical protein